MDTLGYERGDHVLRAYPSSEPSIAQRDANGHDLMYPGPDGVSLYFRGFPVYSCLCPDIEELHNTRDHVYGPDGVPLDGPRTTAAEYADEIAGFERDFWPIYPFEQPSLVPTLVHIYRYAAAYEGERYSEAIRGAREMRRAEFQRLTDDDRKLLPHLDFEGHVDQHAYLWERWNGIPAEYARP